MAAELQTPQKPSVPFSIPFHALKRSDRGSTLEITEKSHKTDEESEKKRAVVCRACAHEITSVDKRIAVQGSHTHTFKNPMGIIYQIGCFSTAPGCMIFGIPTHEFTWFPGFSWCYALCAACHAHIGWNYQSGGESFFGLILDNIQYIT